MSVDELEKISKVQGILQSEENIQVNLRENALFSVGIMNDIGKAGTISSVFRKQMKLFTKNVEK